MMWWQLLWLINENVGHLERAVAEPKWGKYREWLCNRESIRLSQRREILDSIVPDDLCLTALAGCRYRYITDGNELYGGFPDTDKDKLTAVEAYLKYGGSGLVDAVDRGAYRLQNHVHSAVFDPAWRTDTVLAIAQQMSATDDFSALPILADALEDAGCHNEAILVHCRHYGHPLRGRWVVGLIIGTV
jgi:hypothetical protein